MGERTASFLWLKGRHACRMPIGMQNASAHQIPSLPKYLEFSKSGPKCFTSKISKKDLNQTWQPWGKVQLPKTPPQTDRSLWVAKKDLLGNIPGKPSHMKQVSQVMNINEAV